MNKKNLYKLFFKDYFKEEENGFNFNHVLSNNAPDENAQKAIISRNDEIKNVEFKEIPALPIVDNKEPIHFKILYPGLLTGIGLVHDSKKLDGAYNLGMHFDYTWGMPIVYGSSVKGVLREYFKEFYEGDLDVDDLVQDIFSGKVRNTEKDKYDDKGKLLVKGYDNKSIYNRDIFFDAVIKSPFRNDKNQDIFVVDDSITPHTEGPLKNPTPIKMLKIAPGCKIEFRFQLKDSKGFSKKDKLEIFKKILGTVGVGAKTNVGYGQLKIEK